MSAHAGAPPPLSTCQTHSCMADWLVLVSLLLLDLGLFAIGRPVSSSTHPGISCVWMGSLEYREAPCVCVCVWGGRCWAFRTCPGWRDDSLGRRTGCSCRGLGFCFQSSYDSSQPSYNSSPRVSGALFWYCGCCTDVLHKPSMQANTRTHKYR